MKSAVASIVLLVAVAVQAQWPYYNNGFYGAYRGSFGYNFNYDGGYYPTAYSAAAGAYPYYNNYYAPAAYSSSQYHSQDELGQASFGYAHPGQAATNYQDAFGNQVGSYAYINPEGQEIRVSYVADANGFRVVSNALPEGPVANLALPAPVLDTPEVVAARQAHFEAVRAAQAGVVAASPVNPVVDTPEVAAAKMEHAAAHQKARAMAGERKKRQVFGFGASFGHYSPLAYSLAAPVASPLAYTVAAPALPAVREATLTKTVLNPGHAVAYRVD